MNFSIVKTIIISVIILLLSATIYLAVNGFPKTIVNRMPEFTVFYEQSTILRYDGGGNPIGKASVVRVDGWQGSAKPIFGLKEGVLNAGNIRFFSSGITSFEPEKVDAQTNSITAWTKTELDFNGHASAIATVNEIQGGDALAGFLKSPNGNSTATWSVRCIEKVEDGPCPSTFQLTVQEAALGATRVYGSKDFSLNEERNIYASVLGFSSNSRTLYMVTYTGGDIGPGNVGAIDLATGRISVLEANILNGPQDQQYVVNLLSKRDGTGNLYYLKRYIWRSMVQLIRIDAMTGERTVAMELPSVGEPRIAPNESLIVYNDEVNKGFLVYGTQTKLTQRIVSQGEFLAWADDSRHVAYQVFVTNNGFGPKKLYVRDIETGRERLIFDQTVVAQGINTSTKTGDMVYDFVGIR